ncbi:hypothetical protein [Pseudomonas corrugata]
MSSINQAKTPTLVQKLCCRHPVMGTIPFLVYLAGHDFPGLGARLS